VFFAAHQLFVTAVEWWETYHNSHQNVGAITWNKFKARFRTHYVPRGTLKLKKEFSELQQDRMTVNEYLNKFTQMSWYAPDEVNTDEEIGCLPELVLHSFITSSFVAKHNLPITNMKHIMLVSSPGGEMRTKFICPTISISIKGVDFLSNLIILDSKGIYIILGMEWLSKYDGVIQCAKKAVRLTKKDGTTSMFVAAVQAD
jgi:hypothetical protein